ncbi:hypothetical protein KM918_25090 [Priestia megaterium]|uniref:hypothetical protein n=1 Tax=Priestia megaterium TaxID=1404 RepID=UPI001C22C544|nr:hypothetical protein [Priestia megaterium]MBU8690576.1 hypothetical protein [Priestia megaterium]
MSKELNNENLAQSIKAGLKATTIVSMSANHARIAEAFKNLNKQEEKKAEE